MIKGHDMSDNDQMVYDRIRNTLTISEQELFARVMKHTSYCVAGIGQLVVEALRRREKLGLLPDHD